ncbi:hypothetical protein [Patulibacter minatonensis]|uniref:hypothetical protein n=1 Tax=Patulibacter minatonensis TaxID=298163 RepID=UPI00047CE194|nr:hypothetical protein [Patulibacter minatonensis]
MNTTTIGLSPKLIPAVALVILGIIVALAVDKAIGLTAIVGGLGTLGAGYVAPAGAVTIADPQVAPDAHPDDELSDDLEMQQAPDGQGPDSRLTPDAPPEDAS